MTERVDRSKGVYWRIMWSQDWRSRTPWTMSGHKKPYFGLMRDPTFPATSMFTIGPLAIVFVDTREPVSK